jgi:hypothetical protein
MGRVQVKKSYNISVEPMYRHVFQGNKYVLTYPGPNGTVEFKTFYNMAKLNKFVQALG